MTVLVLLSVTNYMKETREKDVILVTFSIALTKYLKIFKLRKEGFILSHGSRGHNTS